jgi:hypothetical protein
MTHLSLRELDMEPCIEPTESVFALHVTQLISTISLNCINRLFFENGMGFALPELEVQFLCIIHIILVGTGADFSQRTSGFPLSIILLMLHNHLRLQSLEFK